MPYGIEYKLNKEQAEFVKYLRVNVGNSWRAVARDFQGKYPDIKTIDGIPIDADKAENRGNQIDGIALCDAAMTFLNETVDDGWI